MRWSRLIFALIPALLLLLFAEWGSRFVLSNDTVRQFLLGETVFDESYIQWAYFENYGRMEPDPYSLYRLRYDDDPDDLRPPKIPAAPGKPGELRIVCLGDSTTYGFRLDYTDTWPTRLEALMNQWVEPGTTVRMFNSGVPAYGPQQCKRLLQSRAIELKPDIILWREEPVFSDLPELPTLPANWRDTRSPMKFPLRSVYLAFVLRDLKHYRGNVQQHLMNLPEQKGKGFVNNVMPQFVDWCKKQGIRAVIGVEYLYYDKGPDGGKRLRGNVDKWKLVDMPFVHTFEAFANYPGGTQALFIDEMHLSREGAKLQAQLISQFLRTLQNETGLLNTPTSGTIQ
jgi:lysophospholipase L1-like esterase